MRNLNFPNRRMRTRMAGGVGGVWRGNPRRPYPDNPGYVVGAQARATRQTGRYLRRKPLRSRTQSGTFD